MQAMHSGTGYTELISCFVLTVHVVLIAVVPIEYDRR